MAPRNFSNITGAGTLVNDISSSATSFNVNNLSNPPSPPFYLMLDRGSETTEVVLCTIVSGNTVTVTRGYDGTSASAHSAGGTVEHVAAAEAFQDPYDHIESTMNVHGVTSFVGIDEVQTLSNKTLTNSPSIDTTGDVDVGGDLSVTGRATVSGPTTLGDVTADSLTVADSLNLPSNLTLDSLTVNDDLDLLGPLTVTGIVGASTNVNVGGHLHVSGNDTVDGQLQVNNDLTTTGDVDVGSSLIVSSSASFLSGNVDIVPTSSATNLVRTDVELETAGTVNTSVRQPVAHYEERTYTDTLGTATSFFITPFEVADESAHLTTITNIRLAPANYAGTGGETVLNSAIFTFRLQDSASNPIEENPFTWRAGVGDDGAGGFIDNVLTVPITWQSRLSPGSYYIAAMGTQNDYPGLDVQVTGVTTNVFQVVRWNA